MEEKVEDVKDKFESLGIGKEHRHEVKSKSRTLRSTGIQSAME